MILNKKTIFLVIVFHFSICEPIYAGYRDIKFERLSVDNGISSSFVECIFQDSRGFLWFGTQDGLNRFDGYKFTVYKNIPGDSTSLSNNDIWVVFEDHLDRLWIGTRGGLNLFDRGKENFKCYINNPDDQNSISNDAVRTILQDRSGDLWIGTENGLNKFESKTKQFTRYIHEPLNSNSLSNSWIWSLCEDQEGVLWIGTRMGLNRFDVLNNQFTHYLHNPNDPCSISNNDIRTVYKDRYGTLWIETGNGLNKFEKERDNFRHYPCKVHEPKWLSFNAFNTIFEDQSGVLWLGSEEGLKIFDREKEVYTHFVADPNDPNSISHPVYTIIEDLSGILWFGGQGAIWKYDKTRKKFSHYRHDPNNTNSLSHNSIRSICADRFGLIWIGTDYGLNRFDRENKCYTRFFHDPQDPGSLSSNRIRQIYEDRLGALWIGTADGLNEFDRATEKFIIYKNDSDNPYCISHNWIESIIEDQKGILWIGTQSGLNKYDRRNGRFTRYFYKSDNPNVFREFSASFMNKDKFGLFWFFDGSSLASFDPLKEQFTNYRQDFANPKSYGEQFIFSICEDHVGLLWLGTTSGLIGFDRKNDTFIYYSEKDGLPNDVVYGILEDNLGNLWLSTNNGISKFNPQTETFRNYNIDDGLQSHEFNSLAYFESQKGEMFFGGINGVNAFYPDSIIDNPFIPPVVITDFQLFNKSVRPGTESPLKKSILESKEVTLTYDQSIFSFEFAGLDYGYPKRNLYAYKMESVDPDWVLTDASRRYASYTQLNPGKYVFRVKASNHDGLWNETGTAIKITIMPPWWRTTWAYGFYIILFAGLVIGIILFNHRRMELRHELKMKNFEAEKLKELDQMKSKFFANISHEFRTPLTLIQGPISQLLSGKFKGNKKEQYKMILRNTNRLNLLINQILDLSKFENGRFSIKPKSIDAVVLIKRITMSFLSLAEFRDIDLKFNTKEKSIPAYLDCDVVEKIVSNLLSNAIKFTKQNGVVSVTVSKADHSLGSFPDSRRNNDGYLEINITDSGIGIPPEHLRKIFDRFYQIDDSFTRKYEGTGLGLALTKEMVSLHQGKIKVESDPQHGTSFRVFLPLDSSYLTTAEISKEDRVEVADIKVEKIGANPYTHRSERHEKSHIEKAKNEAKLIHGRDSKPIVLIIEDNKDVRSFIREFLKKEYQIDESNDGVSGFERAISIIPDLVICDIMMPQMDGLELCRKLKKDERTSHIPIILLTARASLDSKLEGLEIGADDYIIKPFEVDEIKARVNNLIEQRKKLRERFTFETILRFDDSEHMSIDDKFVARARAVIERHMSDPGFTVSSFGKEMGMSRTQIHRKIKALTNRSPHSLIRMMRLYSAVDLLKSRAGNVSEVAYRVGFQSHSHFSKAFRELFGKTPSEYLNQSN